MSQIESQRTPTMVELDAYNKVLALSTYSMEACKPKQKKDKNGIVHNNNHHVPMRYAEIGKYICLQVIQIGSFVLEANDYYVGKNLNEEDRIRNYDMRHNLQTEAIAKT